MKPGDIVMYRMQPWLNFVIREVNGNTAVISTIVSQNRSLKGYNGVYRPTKKEWLHGHKEVHVGDLSSLGLTWEGI